MPSFDGQQVVVAGAGVSGLAAASALRDRGAAVTVVDARGGDGIVVTDVVPAGTDLVVTSPGWRPDAPLLLDAAAQGIDVYGEVELAWRLRPEPAAPWLAVTGTNGKTTTVQMLAGILTAAGYRTVAAGNVGLPLLTAVQDSSLDVIAVELSSFQLHWSSSVRPWASAVLNLAPDHLDWHGSMASYAAAKARIWAGQVSIGNADDEAVRTLLSRAGGRRVTFTLGPPRPGELGVDQGRLVDRAFGPVAGAATVLAAAAELPVSGQHNVANALAAAALARAFGVDPDAVRSGLRAFVAEPHRNALVGTVDGVDWVDDSKATNPHAAGASLADYPRVVWLAGGLLKGADVDDLVRTAAPRLVGVVLLGTDRQPFRDALARHAPDVPVVEVARLDTGAMSEVVAAARGLARAGDTVLLAPAAASMDCFRDYKERGELFQALSTRPLPGHRDDPAGPGDSPMTAG